MAHILIAEHNQAASHYLATTLKKSGNTVTVVDNCLDAWRLTCQADFDFVLLDLAMPGIDGFVLAQNAVDTNPDLNVIFITGFAGVMLDTYGWLTAGGAPLLTTSFHLSEIPARINFLMGQGSLPQRRYNKTPLEKDNIIYANFRRPDDQVLQASQ